jgi:MFS family permease
MKEVGSGMSLSRIRLLHGLEGTGLGILLPFIVPLLSERGVDPAGIGFVLGVSSLAALLSYPVWGLLADGPLGRPRSVAVAALMAAAGGAWLLTLERDAVMLALAVSVVIVGVSALEPITDALTLHSLRDDASAYGPLRAWASIGWAASALVIGAAWAIAGAWVAFVAFALVMVVVAVVALLPTDLPSGRARRPSRPRVARVARVEPAAPGVADAVAPPEAEAVAPPPAVVAGPRRWRPTLASLRRGRSAVPRALVGFLAALFLTGVGLHAAYWFIGLRILE